MTEKMLPDLPDVGDRVRVKHVGSGMGGSSEKNLVGQTGVIEGNDGWGLCTVRLDSGRKAHLWNGADLEFLPQE